MAGHPSEAFTRMFYAYILESVAMPGQFYRGHTDDLKRRLAEHNGGKCPHTSKLKPWKVKIYAAFENLELAQKFEKHLKKRLRPRVRKTPFRLVRRDRPKSRLGVD
jgi:putative endonuclease